MSVRQGNKVIAGHINYHPDLFDYKWADHILNDVPWLRADTFSWQSGAVYQAAYEHLVNDYYSSATSTDYYAWKDNGGVVVYTNTATPDTSSSVYDSPGHALSRTVITAYTSTTITVEQHEGGYSGIYTRYSAGDVGTPVSQTETIAGTTITYYLAADGHKIVLADQESNVTAIYNATGVAWYYILDTTNQRFKLPRTKWGVVGLRDSVGNYVPESLPNITGTIAKWNSYLTGGVSGAIKDIGRSSGTRFLQHSGDTPEQTIVGFDASGSSSVYQNGAPVQQKATEMYLYFYVGNFTQTALENTAGITAETLNDKVDKGHQVIEFQAPTAQNNYTWCRKYADGWVEQGGIYDTGGDQTANAQWGIALLVEMSDSHYTGIASMGGRTSDGSFGSYCVVRDSSNTTTTMQVYVFKTETAYRYINWQVSGMAA